MTSSRAAPKPERRQTGRRHCDHAAQAVPVQPFAFRMTINTTTATHVPGADAAHLTSTSDDFRERPGRRGRRSPGRRHDEAGATARGPGLRPTQRRRDPVSAGETRGLGVAGCSPARLARRPTAHLSRRGLPARRLPRWTNGRVVGGTPECAHTLGWLRRKSSLSAAAPTGWPSSSAT